MRHATLPYQPPSPAGRQLAVQHVRAELKEVELKLPQEIEKVRADLTRDIERSRANILQWSFAFWIRQLAVLLTLLWRLWPA